MNGTLSTKRKSETQRRCRVCQIYFEPGPHSRGKECSPECHHYLVAMLGQPNEKGTDRDH